MKQSITSDEQPKRKIARRVITPKRRYFFPTLGKSAEGADAESALAELNKESNSEVGDGNK